MNFFRYYQEIYLLLTLMFSAGVVLLSFIIYYSVKKYEKPTGQQEQADEHTEPGIPLVLKLVYARIAIYIICATVWIALSGKAIG